MKQQRKRKKHSVRPPAPKGKSFTSPVAMAAVGLVVIAILVLVLWVNPAARETPVQPPAGERQTERPEAGAPKTDTWAGRSLAVTRLFHEVYTPCWEGAYGALGDAYLFALTGDSTLLRFHTEDHDLREMCVGTWVDDRAWVCLAELAWWKVSGRGNMSLVTDAMRRYQEAREEKRLSNHEGFWAWYTYAPYVGYEVFTNSNMNQMVTVACGLYEATGNRKFLEDALLVWNGDGRLPGLEKRWYGGKAGGRGSRVKPHLERSSLGGEPECVRLARPSIARREKRNTGILQLRQRSSSWTLRMDGSIHTISIRSGWTGTALLYTT
ncbi:MAG: DUF6479 family protein [Bacteroidota bacterium]